MVMPMDMGMGGLPGIGMGGPAMGMPPMGGAMPGMGTGVSGMGAGMPGMGSALRDPSLDIEMMNQLMMSQNIGPVYPSWFTPPPKPNAQKVADVAIRRFDEMSLWRLSLRFELLLLRMAESGVFEEDQPGVIAEIMEAFRSTGLVDEFNLAVSWLSGMQRRVTKDPSADNMRDYTRKVKQAAEFLLKSESRMHANKGEMPTGILEPKILLSYGMIVKRRYLNRHTEPFKSPFKVSYIDPAQIVADWDDEEGPARVFRVYSARVRDLANSYGDFTPSARKILHNQYGSDFDDDLELTNVVEYADRWWRCVNVGGAELLPVTAHKYGETPFTIVFGPLGEPRGTMLPEASGGASIVSQTWREAQPYKNVSYIHFRKHSHLQLEAFMTRMAYALKKEIWPAYVRMRTGNAALNPAPKLDTSPGAQNEGVLGEEEFAEMPVPRTNPMDRQAFMQQLERDRMTGSAPMSAYGIMDQSNISGTANKQAAQAGQHLWKPWAHSLEQFSGRDLTLAMNIWKRCGHVVEYGGPIKKSFTVPVAKPARGEAGAFELTRDVIDKVGPDVGVTMVSVNPDEWMTRSQTVEKMNAQGFPMEWLAEQLYGVEYDPQMREEWMEENAIRMATQHPKFVELELIPTMLLAEIAEAEGDPEQQQLLVQMHERWMTLIVQPAMMQIQMEQMQQQLSMTGGPPGPEESPDAMPGSMEGVSLPELGGGPGSVTGNQGGPQGPTGPRGPQQGAP